MEEKPDLPLLEILRRVREAGYPGGKTALSGKRGKRYLKRQQLLELGEPLVNAKPSG